MASMLGGALILVGCGDNRVRLTDAGVPADAAPLADADPSELQVVETIPPSNGILMDRDAEVQVRFDRAVDLMSIDGSNYWAFGQWSGMHRGVYRLEEGDTVSRRSLSCLLLTSTDMWGNTRVIFLRYCVILLVSAAWWQDFCRTGKG